MGKDTIADIITSIRNADMNKKGTVRIASTNITENIVKILLREGFIENVRKHQEGNKYFLVSTLRHRKTRKRIHRTILKRISRPGLRIYSDYQQIPKILGGIGIIEKLDEKKLEANFCYIYGDPPPLEVTWNERTKFIHEGLITESLPNGMFRVRLDNKDVILGYVSGRIRRSFIRILPGDRVKIEVSCYDSTRGRIIYRLRNKDSND
ncbi:hypothetical protein C4D60_Mb00t04420 [Musa balbisiana]|uniref:Small ribosomal subunit protein uS8c n=1 Tax=Musa balbisiana TaxID=52838 RepID=A0A4S8I6L8_MUSBA|nr:hypothetical protein C4D60_Mb00t04420 [Musa balbisiana]